MKTTFKSSCIHWTHLELYTRHKADHRQPAIIKQTKSGWCRSSSFSYIVDIGIMNTAYIDRAILRAFHLYSAIRACKASLPYTFIGRIWFGLDFLAFLQSFFYLMKGWLENGWLMHREFSHIEDHNFSSVRWLMNNIFCI